MIGNNTSPTKWQPPLPSEICELKIITLLQYTSIMPTNAARDRHCARTIHPLVLLSVLWATAGSDTCHLVALLTY